METIKKIKTRMTRDEVIEAIEDKSLASPILTAMFVSECQARLAELAAEGWAGGDWWNHYASAPLYSLCPWLDAEALDIIEQQAWELAWDNLTEARNEECLADFLAEKGIAALDWDNDDLICEWDDYHANWFDIVNGNWHMEGWADEVLMEVLRDKGLVFEERERVSHFDPTTYWLTDEIEIAVEKGDRTEYWTIGVAEYIKSKWGADFRQARIDALLAA